MTIYEKLFEVQQQIKVSKNQYNGFGKYKYRSAEGILESLKPVIKDLGLVILLKDVVESIGECRYIKSTATLIDIETKESIESTAYAREPLSKKGMDESQITGSTSSYARKYALGGILALDDGQDSDSYVPVQEPEKKAPPKAKSDPTITREEAEELYRLSGESGEIENIMKEYKYDRMGTIPKKMYSKIRSRIIENTTKVEDLENE